jgi:aspartate kinase
VGHTCAPAPYRPGGAFYLASPPPLLWRAADVTNNLLVIKLGGDAVAGPEHIAAAARRVAHEAARRPVIVVTSARRGMTDHLLQLCRAVDLAASDGQAEGLLIAADRAVATGEVVTAALLTVALQRLGTPSVTLDARQAGLRGGGPPGGARLRVIRRTAIQAALRSGNVPVVTGFQVVDRGTIRTLGRGGSDVSAVAIAAAFGAQACRFYKLHGLCTADPAADPGTVAVGTIRYPELHRLLGAGAKVLHPDAARTAERYRLRLEFEEFPGNGEISVVAW